MGALRKQMDTDMVVRGMSARTRESYLAAVAGLAKYYGRGPEQVSEAEVQRYLLHLMEERKLACSSCNIAVSGRATDSASCSFPPRSFSSASCCTCCPAASCAFATTACSPTATRLARSPTQPAPLNLLPPERMAPESVQAFCLRVCRLDIHLCPSCGTGRLLVLASLAPAPRSRAPP
jgi:hypothetical protein